MKTHLSQLPHSGRDKNGRLGIDLIDNLGQLIDDYDVIFRELFCVAALALAERLREQLTSVGVLWDEILPTGTDGKRTWPQYPKGVQGEQESTHKQGAASTEAEASIADIAEKGGVPHRQESGSGSLMILVRRVRNDREVDRLVSAGYRFAEVRQVAGLIGSRMQIQSPDIESKLRGMATYTDEPTESRPKVSLGFFGIKARIDNSGFDVLVQRMARDVLPSTSLSLDKFEAWHLTFLKRFGSNSVSYILQELAGAAADDMTPREKAFASQFANSIRDLRRIIQDPLFDDAVLTPNPVNVPYLDHSGLETTTKLLALRLLIPIHGVMTSPSCEFIPLSFFKARALSQKQQLEFMQGIHRELGPVIKDLSERAARQGERGRGRVRWSKLWRKGATSESGWVTETVVEGDDKLISTVTDRRVSSCASLQTDSTAGLYPPGSGRSTSPESDGMGASPPETRPPAATVSQPFSGILVSQEVTVDDEVTDKMDDETYGYPSRLGTWVPPVRTGQKATATLGIEMGSVRHVVTGTQTGGTHVIGGWDTDLGRTETFVDSLFAQCVLAHKIAR